LTIESVVIYCVPGIYQLVTIKLIDNLKDNKHTKKKDVEP